MLLHSFNDGSKSVSKLKKKKEQKFKIKINKLKIENDKFIK